MTVIVYSATRDTFNAPLRLTKLTLGQGPAVAPRCAECETEQASLQIEGLDVCAGCLAELVNFTGEAING